MLKGTTLTIYITFPKTNTKIKLILEHNRKEVRFLFIHIKNKHIQIIVDIYLKPTYTKQYLSSKSHHTKLNKILSLQSS